MSKTVNSQGKAPGFPLPPIVEEIRAHLPEGDAFLVGGAIRDSILRRPVFDIDICLRGSGVHAAKMVADAFGAACYPLDAERGIGRVILLRGNIRYTLDFASLRTASIEEDLALRDFTSNAIALPLAAESGLIDPLRGESDVRGGILRACSPHAIDDDPVRAIRAVRLATQLGFRIEKITKEQARAGAAVLGRASSERIRDEFFRILSGRKAAAAVASLKSLGLLREILPETAGLDGMGRAESRRDSVWGHTLTVLEKLEMACDLLAREESEGDRAAGALAFARDRLNRFRGPLAEYLARPICDERPVRGLLFLAAILHDAAKPETRSVNALGEVHYLGHEQLGADWAQYRSAALRFSNDEADFISKIVRNHMRPRLLQSSGPVTRRAVFRFFRGTGPCGISVCLLFLADVLASHPAEDSPEPWPSAVETVHSLLEGYFERPEEIVHPAPLLSGDDLMREFDLRPGPQIGELLDALREAQAAGEVGSREEALALVERGLGR
ncbi:MAG: CCA tRNA nucleotidyltransferase [Anaerolineales bacterium]|nr:CCA tRNA nucleotidyltransferase [Anaerolineales bacterium]